jgi:hypothetical protein
MSLSLAPTEGAQVAAAQQQEQQGLAQDGGGCGKDCSIDGGGLRSPLEDADILNTLFNKWGADDATEVRDCRTSEAVLRRTASPMFRVHQYVVRST